MTVTRAPIDPEIATFLAAMREAWTAYPPFMEMPLDEARAAAEMVRAPWRTGGPKMTEVREIFVPAGHGPSRIRVYDPGVTKPAPALVYLHGGGFTLFSLDTHDRLMREYAAAGGFMVIGVDYPLSPEVRYPVALDQIVDCVRWLHGDGAAEVGCDPARLAIGGDSAGANLSLATALRLRDAGEPDRLRGMLLNYGAFTGRCSDQAEARAGGPGSVLDRAEMEFYFGMYLGDGRFHSDDPHACPTDADLTGLPPALLIVPDADILAEQSFVMEQRMKASGVDANAIVYPGATHSFLEAMSIATLARKGVADGAAWLKARLTA